MGLSLGPASRPRPAHTPCRTHPAAHTLPHTSRRTHPHAPRRFDQAPTGWQRQSSPGSWTARPSSCGRSQSRSPGLEHAHSERVPRQWGNGWRRGVGGGEREAPMMGGRHGILILGGMGREKSPDGVGSGPWLRTRPSRRRRAARIAWRRAPRSDRARCAPP